MVEIKLVKRMKYASDVFAELTEKAGFPAEVASDFLNNIPDVPEQCAVEVVHARWGYRAYHGIRRLTVSGEVVCGNCHAPFFRVEGTWFKYCPRCGAKMDGGGSE